MDSRYEEPDGGVDCAADHGSVPLGFGTALSGPRLGPRLWLDRKASPACDGHSRQTHCTSLAVAERFCRTIDWVHSPRVPGPHDRPRRGSPAPVADLLRKLLQRNQNASRASERRADPPPNRADWYPEITSDSRRTSSPIRPNVVFGTHRPRNAIGEAEHRLALRLELRSAQFRWRPPELLCLWVGAAPEGTVLGGFWGQAFYTGRTP